MLEKPHRQCRSAEREQARCGDRPTSGQQRLEPEARSREPTLDFLYPGLWLLTISARLKNLIAFVPVNRQRTRYYMRAYHRFRHPLIARPFEFAMNFGNRFILGQDRRVVVTQTPPDSADSDDRLIGADRAIAMFRRELSRRKNSRFMADGAVAAGD